MGCGCSNGSRHFPKNVSRTACAGMYGKESSFSKGFPVCSGWFFPRKGLSPHPESTARGVRLFPEFILLPTIGLQFFRNDMKKHYKRVLTVAGSDPSGGAGIQADLKTFSACGCFGTSAIVAVVDENTMGVTGVHPVPVDFVVGQIRSVLDDIGADAVKIGMLHSSELIRAVRDTLGEYGIRNIVLDPVMVATSGDRLLREEAIATLRNELVPCVRIITPNIPEAEILLGRTISSQDELPAVARALSFDRRVSVLLKAGHLHDEELIDVFYNAESDEIVPLRSQRLATRNTHGTGCTLSSAVASFLAQGLALNDAVVAAKEYIHAALVAGSEYEIGRGHGPVHHFFAFWE